MTKPLPMQPGYEGNPTVLRPVRDLDGGGKRDVTVELRLDILGWLLDHRDIDQTQHDAGRQLQRDYEGYSGNGGHITYERTTRSLASSALSDAKCDAISRFHRAIRSLPQRSHGAVYWMVIERHTAGRASALVGFDRRRVMEQLIYGLDALAQHYGLMALAPVGNRW